MKYMQKIKKVIELFEWFCQNIIWLVMLCCVGFVAVLNLLYRSKVAYVWTEDVSIERTSITALVLAVLIFVVFLIAGSKIQKIDEKILFIVFTVIYIIAGIYWIANVSTELRMDAYSAHNGSVLMRQHDFSFLNPGQDIYLNEHQLSFVTYEYLIGFISTDVLLFICGQSPADHRDQFCDLEADRPVFWTKSQDKSVCDTFFIFIFATVFLPGICIWNYSGIVFHTSGIFVSG